MKKMVLGIFPPGEFPPKKFPPIKLPLENSPRKVTTQEILTWIIPTHLINCLSSLSTLFWQIFTNVKTSALLKHRLQNSLLSNINDNDNEKKKIENSGRNI